MHNWSKILLSAAIAALIGMTSVSAHALRVKRLSLEQLRQHAHSIVLGTVIESSARAGDKRMIWTDYTIDVEETLAGPPRGSGDRVTVSFAGGELQGQRVGILHAPTLTVGERYVLFLLPDRPYAVPTVGWGQGIYRVLDAALDGQGQARQQVLISADGEPLQTASGQLTRGPKLEVETVANGQQRLRLPPAQTLGRSDYFQKEAAPQAVDAEGNELPLTPVDRSLQRRIEAPAQRAYATLDDLRAFIQAGSQP